MKRATLILIPFCLIALFLVLQSSKKRQNLNTPEIPDISPAPVVEKAVSSNKIDNSISKTAEISLPDKIPVNVVENQKKSTPSIKLKLPSSPDITARILPVISGDTSITLNERLLSLGKLGKNLKKPEISAFYQFLNIKNNKTDIDREDLNVLKNDISMLLQDQKNKPEYYAHNLMAMFYDTENDVVWRDYSVQHLGQWYRKEDSSVVQKSIRDLFKSALQETSASIAGTALIALDNNIGLPGITKSYVTGRAADFVRTQDSGPLTRTTALQICARHNQVSILDDARNIAVSREPVPLRMSALAAVGIIGSKQDLPLLEKYAASTDIRLRTAAIAAIKRIKKRESKI